TTSDPPTVPAPVETLRTRFGLTEGVCVGDRGMVKRTGQTVLAAAGSKSITALPPPRCVNCCVRTSCVPSGLPRTSTQGSMARCAWCSAGARPCGARRRDAAPTRSPSCTHGSPPAMPLCRQHHGRRPAQDCRTMKTGRLAVRPLFVRKAPRPRAQVFVTMVAVHVVREMRWALVAAFGTTDDDQRAVTVEEAWVA